MKKPIVSIHVPKCAGGSLHNVLKKVFGDAMMMDKTMSQSKDQLQPTPFPTNWNKLQRFKCIHGHFHIEKYQALNPRFITFVRHPIERFISHYSYVKERGLQKPLDLSLISKQGYSIDQWARRLPNVMTRFLGTDLNKFWFIGFQEKFDESLKKLLEMLGVKADVWYDKWSPNRFINSAKEHIDVTDEQMKVIRACNKEDMKLYEKALELWGDRILGE